MHMFLCSKVGEKLVHISSVYTHHCISGIVAVTCSFTQVTTTLMFSFTLLLSEWPLNGQGLQREKRWRVRDRKSEEEGKPGRCINRIVCVSAFLSLSSSCRMNAPRLVLSCGDNLSLPTECWLSGWGVEIKLTDNTNSIPRDTGPTGQ